MKPIPQPPPEPVESSEPAACESLRRTDPLPRVLGSYSSNSAGPLLLTVGGVHGNEPSGVEAARRVLASLAQRKPLMRGRFVGLTGNIAALQRGLRFQVEDLNRIWPLAPGESPRAGLDEAAPDHDERRELASTIESLIAEKPWERVVVLDLHSTSAEGPPFAIVGDTLQNRDIAFDFGMPVILGLEENIEGTLLGYFGELGHTVVGLEGGQHDAHSTADHHESAIWLALVRANLLEKGDVPDYDAHRERLRAICVGVPEVVEIRHRHGLRPDEDFRMVDGLANFTTVRRGQLLAHSSSRPEASSPAGSDAQVSAPEDGVLLLPRYQGQGLDGFFLGRSVRPVWLRISRWARQLHGERFLALLPGVRGDRDGRRLKVDQRVARWFAVEVFHLLGYRRQHSEGTDLVFTRRIERPLNGFTGAGQPSGTL